MNRLTLEFKKKLDEVKHNIRKKIETAFVQWYLDTRFEKKYEKKLTDGPHDGGIDAVVFSDNYCFVIQSEFCNDLFVGKKAISNLSPKKYAQFDGLNDIFLDDVKFNNFLITVDSSLHEIYKKIAKLLKQSPSKVVWEITTLHSRSPSGERRLRNIDISNIRYASDILRLWELSLEGATPPAEPLELNFKEHFIVNDTELGIKSYVAQAFVKDFIAYMEGDSEFRVLARNVRSELTDKKAKEIKSELISTYRKEPLEFWYSHNGITIICDKATLPSGAGKKLNLKSPYIINGAQSMHALKGLSLRTPKALVLVRIIEVPSGNDDIKKFINSIIFRTNQQNRMFAFDLRANDTFQVDLANKFIVHKIFYERKRGDWDINKRVYKNQGLSRLKSTELAQILMSSRSDLGGVAVAKKSKEDLFSDSFYNKLFNSEFNEFLFKYKLYDFVRKAIKNMSLRNTKGRERNHALLTVFSITWSCIESNRKLSHWYDVLLNTPNKLSVNARFSKELKKEIKSIFSESWNIWKAENRKDINLSANNFFKSSSWNIKLTKKLLNKHRTKVEKAIEQLLI